MTKSQNYANHSRLDPVFHFFLMPLLAINVVVSIVYLYRNPAFPTVWYLVLSVAAFVFLIKMRLYSLKVQDRVIRLEERLRLAQLLSEPTRSRAADLTVGQLLALRFAPDGELPALAEKTISGNLTNAAIKRAILNWRPDHFRV